MSIKKYVSSVFGWIKKNPVEFWILIAILLLGAFFRLYKIDQYMTFLGDEGRDVIIVRRIFTELHPPLIGPGTSVGNMYLGPIYYYMMAIPLLISGFSPVGPAVMVALLGVATIGLVWYVGRNWFGTLSGLLAAFLYTISPTVITFSHSSWNPNIMPFFSLLAMFSIWKVWKEGKLNWLIVLGLSFAFVMQSHYLGLFLIPSIFIFWLLKFIELKKNKTTKLFVRNSIIAVIAFLLLMSPLLMFDLRHNFMNAKALANLFVNRDSTVSTNFFSVIDKIPGVFNLIINDLIGAKNQITAIIVSVVTMLGLLWVGTSKIKDKSQYLFLSVWLLFALIGFGFYKLPIYDHYLGFVFVVPFLLVGSFLSVGLKKNILFKVFSILLILYLVVMNLSQNPFRYGPNRQLQRSKDVASKVLSLNDGKPFNLAVLAVTNYEDGYRYFLELWGGSVLHADRWDPSTISDQLFVICEKEESKCDPTHSPKAEVANFGMTKIDGQWNVDGVIIYKLIHTK